VRYANFAKAAPSPDQTLLDDMQKRRAALCPPECSPREVAVGGRCVARACPGGAFLSRSGACVQQQAPRHIPRQATEEDDSPPPHSARARSSPRAAPSHSGGGGHCFSFNGNQYCE
jgi:hypothetical protein